jgi:DNA-binding transcriptional LysR family regulator
MGRASAEACAWCSSNRSCTIAFSAASTGGVRAAVEAGLGVGVLSSRHLATALIDAIADELREPSAAIDPAT